MARIGTETQRKRSRRTEWCLACRRMIGKRNDENIQICTRCWDGECPRCRNGSLYSLAVENTWNCDTCDSSWRKDAPVVLQAKIIAAIREPKRLSALGDFRKLRRLAASTEFTKAYQLIRDADQNLGLAIQLNRDLTEKNLKPNMIDTSQELSESAVSGYSLRISMGLQEQYLLKLADSVFQSDRKGIVKRLREAENRIQENDGQYLEHRDLLEDSIRPALEGLDEDRGEGEIVDLVRFERIVVDDE